MHTSRVVNYSTYVKDNRLICRVGFITFRASPVTITKEYLGGIRSLFTFDTTFTSLSTRVKLEGGEGSLVLDISRLQVTLLVQDHVGRDAGQIGRGIVGSSLEQIKVQCASLVVEFKLARCTRCGDADIGAIGNEHVTVSRDILSGRDAAKNHTIVFKDVGSSGILCIGDSGVVVLANGVVGERVDDKVVACEITTNSQRTFNVGTVKIVGIITKEDALEMVKLQIEYMSVYMCKLFS